MGPKRSRSKNDRLKAAHQAAKTRVCAECGAPAMYRYARKGVYGLFGACETHKATAVKAAHDLAGREDAALGAVSHETDRRTADPPRYKHYHRHIPVK